MRYSLQQLSDRMEIEDLLTEYADAIDTGEFDRLDQVFCADAFIDYRAMGGIAGLYPEIKTFLTKALTAFSATQHMIGNYHITLHGDKARGKILCFNPMVLKSLEPASQAPFFLGLWYLDEYVRTEKGWRIARREEIKSFSFNAPAFMGL
mgnify:FL=1